VCVYVCVCVYVEWCVYAYVWGVCVHVLIYMYVCVCVCVDSQLTCDAVKKLA